MKLNGNLVLNALGQGEIQNAYIERLPTAPTVLTSEKGRIYFHTGNATYYYNDSSAWVAFATGGNAAALQTEVDNIEAALGTVVSASTGAFQSAAFSGAPIIAAAGSVTEAITMLATFANGKDQLSELADVAMGTLSNGQYLKYNASTSKWYNETLVLADVTNVTALAADVNLLGGLAASGLITSELGYVHGVTSAIQTQLNGKQPLNTGLNSLSVLANATGTGIVVQSGVDTFVERSLVAPAAGITITNNTGVDGNPTFVLANDLAALEGLSTTGYVIRTGDGTATTRSIVGTASNIIVTNNSGVSSDTSIDLASVSQAATGSFVKVTLDGFGRVTGNTPVTTADITALADSTYVNATGDTMTGSLVMATGTHITLTDSAINATDAVNKAYVDASIAGLTWKNSVAAATTGAAVLATAFAAGQTLDGYTLVLGDRVLVKDQAVSTENGIYVVTAGAPTRALDADTGAELDHATVFVEHGTAQAATAWTVNNATTPALTGGTNGPNFVQFNGASSVTAGVGLNKSGNTLSVKLGAGITELSVGNVGVDLWNADGGNGALILTTDGSTHSTDNASKLFLLIDSGAGLEQSISGLKISAGGVTNAMLAHSSIGVNTDTGTSTLALGGTLEVKGVSTQGISTSQTVNSITVTAVNASATQRGVATFNAASFDASVGGDITIKLAGVSNAQLANSSVTFAATDASSTVQALGSTLTITGGTSVTTVATANTVTINVANASTTVKGIASFSATDFAVSGGAVSLVAKGLSSLTDVAVTTPSAGQTLVYVAGTTNKFLNRPTYFLFTGSTNTTHVVAHGLGQQYCNVTVVDATDEVVIPQSIKFDSANQLTVTFTSSIACKVVVMGVNAA